MKRLRRDGVDLYYEEEAGGKPDVLLVHGWCCDHTYLAPQFERYAARGHRAVAADLRGLYEYDPSVLAPPVVPGVYIAADEAQPRSDMGRFHEMFPDVFYGKTVGSGHFCQLEVPDQIVAMVDRFLAIALPR